MHMNLTAETVRVHCAASANTTQALDSTGGRGIYDLTAFHFGGDETCMNTRPILLTPSA